MAVRSYLCSYICMPIIGSSQGCPLPPPPPPPPRQRPSPLNCMFYCASPPASRYAALAALQHESGLRVQDEAERGSQLLQVQRSG